MEAVRQVGMVVEGINAIPAAVELAQRYRVEMPIVAAVDAVVHHGAEPRGAVAAVMDERKKTGRPERLAL